MQYSLSFFGRAILTNFKLSLALKAAFFLTVFATVLKQILFLVAWNFFFAKYKIVAGWNFEIMLLMYGIACFAIGVAEAFFYGLKDIPRLIESNQLDTFLLQPKNIILNIGLSKGDISSFGEILTGLILISYSGYMTSDFPMIVVVLIMSILFIFALLLYINSIAFFMKNPNEFIRELQLNAVIIATQPNAAYRGAIKMLTFFILPVAFLSFFPIEFFRTGLWKYLFLSFLGTGVFFGFSCWLFHRGLKRYESGNVLAVRH